jgi:integrase
MASIGIDSNGRKRILFIASNGRRKTIRLGKASQRQAVTFKAKIESLIAQRITGAIDDEVSKWLADLPDAMHARISAAGLARSRERSAATVGKFLTDFFATVSVKPSTMTTYENARRGLLEFFGAEKPMRDIEHSDADKYRQYLAGQGLAEATISRRIIMVRMIFRRALRWKLISENPFDGVHTGKQTNKARQFFISREMADKVTAACSDAQWRLMFALSRYGGLRCPSEHLLLKWGDVDFENGRITVTSPKTEHHEGKDSRVIPLFPELREPLLKAFGEAEPGAVHVITRARGPAVNLRTQLRRIIKRAGLTPWPKLWHNLRASRQTELSNSFPAHVVCAWLGNSIDVANDHYLQVTDDHFASAAQNQAHQPFTTTASHEESHTGSAGNAPALPVVDDACESLQTVPMGRAGLEPATSSL